MSVEAFSWALTVPIGGNAKVILLGLANHAHPDGTESYPALDTLAKYAHCDRSTARRNVRKLLAEGWIVEDGHGPRGQVKYRLPVAERGGGNLTPRQSGREVAPGARGGGTSARGGVAPVPPEPSIEPFDIEPVREGARERAQAPPSSNGRAAKFKGRPIPVELLDRAVKVLGLYNDIFGRALEPFSATGEQAPHLTQILGKVVAHQGMEAADFERVLRAVHANPPGFLDGQPVGLGDIFGPRAWTRALENPGRATGVAQAGARQGQVGWANAEAGDLSRFTFGAEDD
jgi:hypothetical protein